MWLAQRPVERWAAEMVRTDCGPGAPPPPEGSPIGWVAVALAVAGIACVAVASASALRRSPGRKAMALIVIAVPAAMLVGVLLVLGGSATALVQPDIFTVGDPAGGPLCPFDSSRSF